MRGKSRCDCPQAGHLPASEADKQQMMADLMAGGWEAWQVADLAGRAHLEVAKLAARGFPARPNGYSPFMREVR